MKSRTGLVLLIGYIVLFIVAGIEPYDRTVWRAENLPIVLIVAALVISYRWFVFSPTAYILMAFLIYLHTIGGHYTFERVPFGAVTDFFGFERNHYDRMAHVTVGFYAYAIAELLWRKHLSRSKTIIALFAVFSIVTVAALYEIFEWQFAVLGDPAAGIAVLGSQGDVWDAQKDMLADTLGAVAAVAFFFIRHRGTPLNETPDPC